jgi:DNA-binding Lrp family transcriptional regulator
MRNSHDDLDWIILGFLKIDARTPYVNIAKKLKVSEGMVRQRVKKMVESGIIRRFTAITASLGLKAIIEISVGANVHTTEIAERIKLIDDVESVYEVSGNRDIIAIIDVENTLKLNDVIEKIRSIKDVSNTETQLVLKEI